MATKRKIKTKKKPSFKNIHLYIIILLMFSIGILIALWKSSQQTTFKLISNDTWSFVSQIKDNTNGPHFGRGIIKERYPTMGTEQRVTIEVSDTAPVKKVTAALMTDKKSEWIELLPGTGTSYKSDWTGVWTLSDTYLERYVLSIEAMSANGVTKVEIPLK